ncbi:hypothetical protein J2X19_005145 [Rhodoferax ferrireducens]|uniref:Ribbon-helix-helix protein CopG domain-containing protein n=1 Tax=Rhodoferax ferrireducens TaxID=192843 RepID=A0ABU2CGI0_9BURK|nr:hypothetical protein [Rhodoferax ferrireducens]MDR7380438.1 hypothetical protein [Rhodoferax ferrireducens]
MANEKVFRHIDPMTGEIQKEKKTRRKRRLPGTDKPPRVSFSLRVEKSTFDRMNKMLKAYKGSRNEYIERLIEFDLSFRERLQPLNTPIDLDKPTGE